MKYIEKLEVYKVCNGYVIQIRLVGISTELTFVSEGYENLAEMIDVAIVRALKGKA